MVRRTFEITVPSSNIENIEDDLENYALNSSESDVNNESVIHSEDDTELPIEIIEVPGTNDVHLKECIDHKAPQIPDGGWGWVVVASAFIILVCADGVGFSFGLLRDELANNFKTTQSKTSLIGSLFIAIPLLTGPIMSALVDRYGCKTMTIISGLLSTIGFLLASISKSIPVLCLTYGFIGGLAVGILHVTSVVSLTFWFNKRRNLAMSFASCGFGIGPLIYTPMINYFLDIFSWQNTIVLLAGILLNMCVCGVLMRTPSWLKMVQKREKAPLKNTKTRSPSLISLSSRVISRETIMNSRSEVNINIDNPPSCNSDPGILPAQIKPKEPTTLDSEPHNDIENKVIITETTKPNSKVNTKREEKYKDGEEKMQRPWYEEILSDHHYLKGITLYRNRMVYRGAMTSITKYRLRSTLRPDVYSNSNWSLDSGANGEFKWYLRLWMTPENTDDFNVFKKFRFGMFSLCSLSVYAWSIFPYFFLNSYMAQNSIDGEVTMICVIAISSIIGTVGFGWAGDQPWMNVTKVYASCLIICGFSVGAYPLASNYGILVFISVVFGITFASSYSFTPAILMDLMPIDKFTMAYGIVLLGQGIGHLIGPPIGGMLYDKTCTWAATFYLGSFGLILSGICMGFIAHNPVRCRKT